MHIQLIDMIQRQWQCHVYAIRNRRKVFRADTNKGPLFIKGYPSANTAKWVVSLAQQLEDKGFKQGLEYCRTINDTFIVPFHDEYFVAIQSIKGRDAHYDHVYDIMHSVRCLGEYHRYAVDIVGGPVTEVNSIPLIDKWEKRLERFVMVTDKIKSVKHNRGLQKKISCLAPYVIHEARKTLDIAVRSPLVQEYQLAYRQQKVAHGDLASHNFLIGNQIYLIDYDTAVYDTQLSDLVQMINRVLDQQKWSFECFYQMMEEYQMTHSLTEQQYALVYFLLGFPDNFMREVNGLYDTDTQIIPKKLEGYLTRIIEQWQKRVLFFRGSHHLFQEETETTPSIVV